MQELQMPVVKRAVVAVSTTEQVIQGCSSLTSIGPRELLDFAIHTPGRPRKRDHAHVHSIAMLSPHCRASECKTVSHYLTLDTVPSPRARSSNTYTRFSNHVSRTEPANRSPARPVFMSSGRRASRTAGVRSRRAKGTSSKAGTYSSCLQAVHCLEEIVAFLTRLRSMGPKFCGCSE